MSSSTVTSKGQITIPVEVRRALGLRPGTRVAFVRNESGSFELRLDAHSVRVLKGIVPPPPTPVTLDDMDRAVAEGAG